MQAIFHDLVLIQDEIRKSFGWTLQSDYDSALQLSDSCKKPVPSISLPNKVTVVGAAVSPNYTPSNATVVADGAVGAINDLSNVVLIVTDGDGSPYLERALNQGIPICLHAHGDNIATWKKLLTKIDEEQEVILTHQTPYEIPGMFNPGGFTDGDRAVCIAMALGATEIELVGFSVDEVGMWSGVTDKKRKLMKLKWMNKVLKLLSLEIRK
jgi:2-amino-4-hydroxy-6-hydroxymethyldihydropteridine diphosphokinase